ncbi:MAG TPA: DJ-1/PfpI family protein [Thermoanaerobaculia bacterium]|nr:DJ-1/PfpI family protein [Thermoanaerobaculia bacterium]
MKKLSVALFLLLLPSLALAQTPVKKTVVILAFEGVGALDFAGPFEVFTTASELGEAPVFQVYVAAEKPGPLRGHNGMVLQPDCVLADCPPADLQIISGGPGAMQAMNKPELLDWIRKAAGRAERVVSVCTGAFLLAKAGLLDGLTVTTHQAGIGYLGKLAPKAKMVSDRRFVDNGKIVTSAGMSAGIDASLHLVAQLLGAERAKATATWMEYDWKPQS